MCILIRGNPYTYVITYTYECVLWEAVDSCDATGPKKDRQTVKQGGDDDDE